MRAAVSLIIASIHGLPNWCLVDPELLQAEKMADFLKRNPFDMTIGYALNDALDSRPNVLGMLACSPKLPPNGEDDPDFNPEVPYFTSEVVHEYVSKFHPLASSPLPDASACRLIIGTSGTRRK
jgi:hypothetical protein